MAIKTCVSLYSLQDKFMRKEMTLRDIFQFMSDHGVQGIELLPDQMLHGAPNPPEEVLREWDALVADYPDLTLVCDDMFLNTNLYKNRELTRKECIDLLVQEMELAHRLGFKLMRFVSMIPAWTIEPLLPHARRLGIDFAVEIHAGLGFGVPATQAWLDEMVRLGDPHCGIVVDTGIFCRRMPRVFDRFNREVLGVNPEVIEFFGKTFEEGKDGRACFKQGSSFAEGTRELVPELAAIAKPSDMPYIMLADGYENTPLEVLDPYFEHIKHFHFKLYEMTEEGVEYSIDYREIIQYLHDRGYDGYVSTEYEGNRWTMPGQPLTECEQVVAHQDYIHRLIAQIEG